jgi:hypothetical protein
MQVLYAYLCLVVIICVINKLSNEILYGYFKKVVSNRDEVLAPGSICS